MAITIGRDASVVVRVPRTISDARAEEFILSRAGWIVKHTSKIAIRNAGEKKNLTDGEVHHLLGRPLILKISETGRNRIFIDGDTIRMETRGPWNRELGERLFKSLTKRLASEIFSERLSALIEKHREMNFRPSGLKVRNSISRWGSCSANGSICLSTRLLTRRIELIDYVLLHELCHLHHRNHGRGFYKLLQSVCPEYRELQRELRSGSAHTDKR
jgi:predicted metal-dependent hydrolase